MKKDKRAKRAKRAKKKAKQANITRQKQRALSPHQYPDGVTDLGMMPSSNQMKVGVKNGNEKIIETIDTDGLTEFLQVVGEYQEKGFTDIYENKNTPIDGYDAMFVTPVIS